MELNSDPQMTQIGADSIRFSSSAAIGEIGGAGCFPGSRILILLSVFLFLSPLIWAENAASKSGRIPFFPVSDTAFIPRECLPMTGCLVLRDVLVDDLIVEGCHLKDPKAESHPLMTQNFRGFYNVPPFTSFVNAVLGTKTANLITPVRSGDATVKVLDWGTSSWLDDSGENEALYKAMAFRGNMSGALRPWPCAMLFVIGARGPMTINKWKFEAPAPFFCICGILPKVSWPLLANGKSLEIFFPPDSVQVLDASRSPPALLPVNEAVDALSKRAETLDRAPLLLFRLLNPGAKNFFSAIGAPLNMPPNPIPAPPSPKTQTRQPDFEVPGEDFSFGDFPPATLSWVKETFEDWRRSPSLETFDPYYAALSKHRIPKDEIANHGDYFLLYADEIMREVRQEPSVLKTAGNFFFTTLAEDLEAIGGPFTAKGRELRKVLRKN